LIWAALKPARRVEETAPVSGPCLGVGEIQRVFSCSVEMIRDPLCPDRLVERPFHGGEESLPRLLAG
jgi:hypothetical protein